MPQSTFWSRRSLATIVVGAATLIAALAPWLRNRSILRDFLDYGLMMTAAGRIESGQRPYRDFVTPLQSATYAINTAMEQLWGGTFQAMTMGNGICIALCLALLAGLLARRFSPIVAMLLGGAIVIGTLSQHTIIWYNALGVIALATVGWTTAMAPTLRRADWGCHLVVAAGLVLSGTNKLNFHAIALAAALAWTIRAGLLHQASWRRVAATCATWLFAGLALPVAAELAWTGATWAQWKFNVITLPFSARGTNLEALFTVNFYLQPMHDYYGPVLRPVGAIVIVWTVLTAGFAWRGRSPLDRLTLVALGIFTIGATAGLMATNHEIIYVSLAAGMALIVNLWLGFDLWSKSRWQQAALLTPTLVLAAVMWQSAWRGQRSQFGHSEAPRAEYRELESTDSTFAYLAGTRIPPDLATCFDALPPAIPPAGPDGLHPVFYGVGVEWLERVWPELTLPNMPLLIDNLTLGPTQVAALRHAFGFPAKFDLAISMNAWSAWPAGLDLIVDRNTSTQELGRLKLHRFSQDWLHDGPQPQADAIAVLNDFGGNLDPHAIVIEQPLWAMESGEGRGFLGTCRGQGAFLFQHPSSRLSGTVVLRRLAGTDAPAASATFRIFDTSLTDPSQDHLNWEQVVTLPAGEESIQVDYHLDTRGAPTRFQVEVAAGSTGLVSAGYFLPQITHSDDTDAPPPTLRYPAPATSEGLDLAATDLLPATWRDQFDVVVRQGQVQDGHLVVARGGELWLHPHGATGRLHGTIALTAAPAESGTPVARVVWTRGGRIQILYQGGVNQETNPLRFDAWPAESGGWYGILIDANANPHGVALSIEKIDEP